jgi:hypothetical protein
MEVSKEACAQLLERFAVALRERSELLGSAMPFGSPIDGFRARFGLHEQAQVIELAQFGLRLLPGDPRAACRAMQGGRHRFAPY